MTAEVLRSLDLLVLFDDHHETFSNHTIPEATGMTRITTVLVTVLSLAFTPLAAQETNCDDWMASDWDVTKQFWEAVTLETVSDCLNSGSDVNARGVDGRTPIHVAALKNYNLEVVTLLLEAGADVNARDISGITPLHMAAQTNNPEVLTALIGAGGDLTARGLVGSTPLHGAALFNDNPEVITALLDAGADGTAVNERGQTPFDRAKYNEALAGTDAYWALNDARFE